MLEFLAEQRHQEVLRVVGIGFNMADAQRLIPGKKQQVRDACWLTGLWWFSRGIAAWWIGAIGSGTRLQV